MEANKAPCWYNSFFMTAISGYCRNTGFSKSFINLLIINTIIPIQFAYTKSLGKETSETILDLLREVAPEKNIIIEKFSNYGVKAQNAFETQSLLQLKN